MSKGKVSIVVPMYNEQESLEILYQELNRVTDTIKDYEFEYLFVNDGSKDNTLQEIQRLATADDRVRYVSADPFIFCPLFLQADAPAVKH